ncbi:MAG: hypothetical protein IIA49_06835, partial [Bacteroidetes bacterium]|nr:hypothetical protein [Bacteroidota bacterium]
PNYKKRWYYIEDIAFGLIGLDSIFNDFWTEELSSLISDMENYYKKWTDEYLLYSKCAENFINFLRQPATTSIILEGLRWVETGYKKHINNWNEEDIVEPLAYLLNTVWIKHREAMRKNVESFSAFKFLLSKLIERQNPIALEIQNQIS